MNNAQQTLTASGTTIQVFCERFDPRQKLATDYFWPIPGGQPQVHFIGIEPPGMTYEFSFLTDTFANAMTIVDLYKKRGTVVFTDQILQITIPHIAVDEITLTCVKGQRRVDGWRINVTGVAA